eukprot:9791134-Alexandrium_andersonii.AAC.1
MPSGTSSPTLSAASGGLAAAGRSGYARGPPWRRPPGAAPDPGWAAPSVSSSLVRGRGTKA